MMRFEYRATMEDGTTLDVVADQRDVAAWEVSPNGCSFLEVIHRPFAYARYVAWHAASRSGLTTMDVTTWEAKCVQVDSVDADEAADSEDPGQPTASVGT